MIDPAFFLGRVLNDYDVLSFRGQGAFSLVYEARHLPTSSIVALKILKPTANLDQIREFENEGHLLLNLSGATRVVNILDTGTAFLPVTAAPGAGTTPIPVRYHALELAAGCLDEVVANLATIPWVERLALYRDVVLGAHQMHLHVVMHRDLKSSNCLLFEAGAKVLQAKVTDLGRGRDLSQPALAAAVLYRVGRGDPNFWPPEMFWSLG